MERIIITEVDNTSNVEALSSYDVVYVPGFSSEEGNHTIDTSLYRTPTLVTTKYQFYNLFGRYAPKFASNQHYPVATASSEGFPSYAIPNYTESVVYTEVNTTSFESLDAVTESAIYSAVDNSDPSWTPIDGTTYFTATLSGSVYNMAVLTTQDSYAGLNIYTGVNPQSSDWYELSGSTYSQTTDTVIDLSKQYYTVDDGEMIMFQGGTTDADADPGYRYALALLSQGIPVYYEQMNEDTDGITIQNMYAGLENRFWANEATDPATYSDYSFDNIGDYSIKYFTSGGYPTFEYGLLDESTGHTASSLAEAMITIAYKRQDAVALIDHTDNPDRPLTVVGADSSSNSVIDRVRSEFSDLGEVKDSFGAMFTPWYTCSHTAVTGTETTGTYQNVTMPGSLAFLSALAQQLQNYNPWLAVSGVTRGRVPYCESLHTTRVLTNNIADSYQVLPNSTNQQSAISINPITYIRNYGYCIWGNRTLRNNSNGTKATSFLNIRDLVSDIKKRIYEASQSLLFEQNTDVLWLNFTGKITPLLDTMVSNYILNTYQLTRLTIDPDTGADVPAYEVMAVLRIQPINSVEVFDVSIRIENEETTVAESTTTITA